MSTITLENMEFYAYHGCLEHEKEIGNTYHVTLTMDLDTSTAEKTDNLNDTLNYKEVYDVVKKTMNEPVDLIEHLANKVINSVMSKFPEITQTTISLSKNNPPVGGKVEKVTIKLTQKRE